ncbi:DUF397 domain-containing protein [Pseudonocardia acaciae]|uniref:DUF397 domain-containing protein n=1 Tax=Pseudonocardia acaciae TaxID=551276 RepID=UPI00048D97D9|nr:DUF397 domain-containing protein [Pseudonocardia acaciae]
MNDTVDAPVSEYRKSSYSRANGQCVEIAVAAGGGRWVRDSKHRERPPLEVTARGWAAFVRGVKNGEFGNP